MLERDLAVDEAYPVEGCHRDDSHHTEFIDGGSENKRIEKDEGKLRHQKIDALVLKGSEG